LRVRRARPQSRGPEEFDEFAPSHCPPQAQDYACQLRLQQGFVTGEMVFNHQFALQKS
jgi:hypothetical protein